MGLLYFYLLPITIYFFNVNIPCNIYNPTFLWDVNNQLSISLFIYLFIYLLSQTVRLIMFAKIGIPAGRKIFYPVVQTTFVE